MMLHITRLFYMSHQVSHRTITFNFYSTDEIYFKVAPN